MDVMDASVLDQKGLMSNEFSQQLSDYFDAVGVEQLEQTLRLRITDYLKTRVVINGRERNASYRILSEAVDISRTYITDFHAKDRAICITNMNKLAEFFDVKYIVSNFRT